jgi:hypothetical protein
MLLNGAAQIEETGLLVPQFALLHSVTCVQLGLITILGNCGCVAVASFLGVPSPEGLDISYLPVSLKSIWILSFPVCQDIRSIANSILCAHIFPLLWHRTWLWIQGTPLCGLYTKLIAMWLCMLWSILQAPWRNPYIRSYRIPRVESQVWRCCLFRSMIDSALAVLRIRNRCSGKQDLGLRAGLIGLYEIKVLINLKI